MPLQSRETPQQSFEQKFLTYLKGADYQNWAPLPGVSGDFYPGNSPHGASVKLVVNRKAATAQGEFPPGSILIKHNYGPDQASLMAITVMYRAEGYDPQNQDWYWIKYEPDGQISQMEGMNVAGRVNMCIECHSSAGGGDYVFANDGAP